MLDAYGRPPAGRTQGSSTGLGMYDQCLAIAKELNITTIKGKYCYAGLVVPLISLNPSISQLEESVNTLWLTRFSIFAFITCLCVD